MHFPLKKLIAVLLSLLIPLSSCTTMEVRYSEIMEKDIGEVSFIAFDEESGRLMPGVICRLYRAGEEEPFRDFISDGERPVQLTSLEPGDYFIKANKYLDAGGKRHSISGSTTKYFRVEPGKRAEVTLVVKNTGEKVVAAMIVVLIVVIVALAIIAAAKDKDGDSFKGITPRLGGGKVFSGRHRDFRIYPRVFLNLSFPPPTGRTRRVVVTDNGRRKLSPDVPFIVLSSPSSETVETDAPSVTVSGTAASMNGVKEIIAQDATVFKASPGKYPGKRKFSFQFKGLKPGNNPVRLKVIDAYDFSSELYLNVVRRKPAEAPASIPDE